MLGFGRAWRDHGGDLHHRHLHSFPKSLFDSGSTIASTIANEFTEATSPVHTGALIALGLVLFLITFTVLGFARFMLRPREGR